MATLQQLIADRLNGDAALTLPPPDGLGFLVFARWLSPAGPGSTPSAFDPTQGGRMKRSIVVMDGGEVAHPARQPAQMRRWDSFPPIYIFAEAHQNGKQAAWDARDRIERLLAGWDVALGAQHVGFVPESVSALEDAEAFPGNVVLVARWRATGVRQLVPA
jgi:hypothetical protein